MGSVPINAPIFEGEPPKPLSRPWLGFLRSLLQGALSISFAGASAQDGVAYIAALTAAGGAAPYTFSIAAGSLPPGLALDGSGQISGIPTAAGTFPFTGQVTDSQGTTAQAAFSIAVSSAGPLGLSFAGGPAQQGVAYSGSLVATGGQQPYTYAITSGALPAGLTLGAGGRISGTPTTTGTATFTGQVTDSQGNTASASCTITVGPASVATAQISAVAAAVTQTYQGDGTSTWANVQITPTWSSGSGAQNVTVWLFYRAQPGGSASWYWMGVFPATVGTPFSIQAQIVPGASVSAKVAVEAGSVQGDSSVGLASAPAGTVQSSAFTLYISAPGSATSATLTNMAGAAPTVANIFMGKNSLGNPYWEWVVQFNPAGRADPNCWVYELWGAWVDSAGNLINAGGVANTYGWQRIASCGNDAVTHTFGGAGNGDYNYPGLGVDAYYQFLIVGRSQNATAVANVQTAGNPYTGDPNTTVQNCWASFSGTYARVHVGVPNNVNPANQGASNTYDSLAFDPFFAYLNGPYGGGFVPASYAAVNHGVSFWQFNNNTGANIYAQNADGPSVTTSLKFLGDGSHSAQAWQNVPVTPGSPYNIAFQCKSSASAPTASFTLSFLDASFNVIAGSTSSTTFGPFSSWQQVFVGTFTAPLNAAYLLITFSIQSSTPAGQWWEWSNVLVQGVVNQTGSGQTNSTAPTAQSAGASATSAKSTMTTAASYYGLSYAQITAPDGTVATIGALTGGGSISVYTPGSTSGVGSVGLSSASTLGPNLDIARGDGHGCELTADGFTSVGTVVPVTGNGFAPSYQGGVAYGSLYTPVTSVGNPGTNSNIPTEAAVRTAIAAVSAGGPSSQGAPGRSLNTVYHNTTGKTIYALVTLGLSSANGQSTVAVGSTSSPSNIAALYSQSSSTENLTAFFIVLPNYYFEVVSAGTLLFWEEWS